MDHKKIHMANTKRIDPQTYLQNILRQKFQAGKLKNKSYSLRAYAKKLKISHSVLSEILRGKRKVSAKMAIKLFQESGQSIQEQKKIKDLFLKESNIVLEEKDFSLISEWQYFAILALMETEFFKETFSLKEAQSSIQRHLRLDEKKTKKSLKRLVKMQLIKACDGADNLFQLTSDYYSTTEDIPSRTILKAHMDSLDMAKSYIKETKTLKREVMSITFSGDRQQMVEAKKIIRDFRDELCKKMKGTKRDTVYKMHVLLYPLTS